jgi:ADP-ribose pyrophosphatase YjhB (NUDIX family)
MNFCSHCGQSVTHLIPDGDDRSRHVCSSCDTVHYQNPQIIVGCIPVLDDKVLLCKRAIEPRKGYWTLPAGFMENGETTQAGAIRETWEEARAKVTDENLYRIFDLPHINQVYIFYRGNLVNEAFKAGPESQDVGLFSERDIPWDEIAFPGIPEVLREFFADRKKEEFPVRSSILDPM